MKEMKISKLFHWLYAFLMLVPVAIFGANTIYYGFNDKAEAQEYTKQEPLYYETNEISNSADFTVGHVYSFNDNVPLVENAVPGFMTVQILNGYLASDLNYAFYCSSDTNLYIYNTTWIAVTDINFDFKVVSVNTNIVNVQQSVIDCFSSCPRKYANGLYEDVTYTMGIADSLVNSLDHTFDLPMFKWTRDSVVYTAFNGLSVFAGLGENSIFACFLTYWLDISLIWLAFDMLMFLPMWAHSMLDKKKGW